MMPHAHRQPGGGSAAGPAEPRDALLLVRVAHPLAAQRATALQRPAQPDGACLRLALWAVFCLCPAALDPAAAHPLERSLSPIPPSRCDPVVFEVWLGSSHPVILIAGCDDAGGHRAELPLARRLPPLRGPLEALYVQTTECCGDVVMPFARALSRCFCSNPDVLSQQMISGRRYPLLCAACICLTPVLGSTS